MPVGYVIWGLDDYDAIEQLAWFRDQGLQSIGFHTSPTLAPDKGIDPSTLSDADFARLEAALEGYHGLELHAPFGNYDVSFVSPNPYVRTAAVNTLAETCALAQALGAAVVTVHSGHTASRISPAARSLALRDSLPQLDRLAAQHEVPIAMEVADHFLALTEFGLLDELACEHLGICLDTGHICFDFSGRPAFAAYGDHAGCIKHWGARLRHVHLHDYKFAERRDHLSPGDGELDIDAILAALRAIDYPGLIHLELAPEFCPPREVPAQVARIATQWEQG